MCELRFRFAISATFKCKESLRRSVWSKVHESISLPLPKDKFRTPITPLSSLSFVCLPLRFFLSTYPSSNYFFALPLPILPLDRAPLSLDFKSVILSRSPIFPSSPYASLRSRSALILKTWSIVESRIRRHRFHRLTLCMQTSLSCKVGHRNAPARNYSWSEFFRFCLGNHRIFWEIYAASA